MPRRKSDKQKRAQGTMRPVREFGNVVEWPNVVEAPDPPSWLSYPAGLALWERMTPYLVSQRVFSVADIESFAHLCQLHGQVVEMYERGESPRVMSLQQLRVLFGDFGMTPSSRNKVKSGNSTDSSNKFANNGPKKA